MTPDRPPLTERVADWWEALWECRITRRHRAKFSTYPYCYRHPTRRVRP